MITVARAAIWTLVVGKLVGAWGLTWDIQWHLRIGRDSFWIAPHLMMYAGVTAGFVVAFGVLALETWRARRAAAPGDAARGRTRRHPRIPPGGVGRDARPPRRADRRRVAPPLRPGHHPVE